MTPADLLSAALCFAALCAANLYAYFVGVEKGYHTGFKKGYDVGRTDEMRSRTNNAKLEAIHNGPENR